MGIETLLVKLNSYKRKKYLGQLIQGTVITLALLLSIFIVTVIMEFNFHYGIWIRTILFYFLILLLIISIGYWIVYPLFKMIYLRFGLSDAEIAIEIGKLFPEIKDKLLNTIQLQDISNNDSSLIEASLNKRIDELKLVPFSHAISLSVPPKYIYFAILTGLVFLIMSLNFPNVISESSERLIHHKKEFVVEAPFSFHIINEELKGFQNEDFELKFKIEGEYLPDYAFINYDGRKIKLVSENEVYVHSFPKLQSNRSFYMSAAGFRSENYFLRINARPELSSFNIYLNFPNYTKIENEVLNNKGNLVVPAGTKAKWTLKTFNVNNGFIVFNSQQKLMKLIDNQVFTIEKRMFNNESYEIVLQNEFSKNREKINYKIDIIPDEYPTLKTEFYADTILYEYLIVAGNISDDYGITSLSLKYDMAQIKGASIPIQFNDRQLDQTYYFRWNVDSLLTNPDNTLTVYVEAMDNDAIGGNKSVRSRSYAFRLPDKEEVRASIQNKSKNTKSQINNSIEDAKNINDRIKELEERLRSKQTLDWQEEKLLQELISQRNQLEEELEKLQKEFSELRKSEDKFNDRSSQLREKAQKLDELMKEVLDEETRKLYDELQKLLEESRDMDEVRNQLSRISPNEKDLEKELERALELFKRLKVESEIEKMSSDLKELAQEQENVANETNNRKSELESILEEQDSLKSDFNELKEKMDQIEDLNQDLKDPEPLQDTQSEELKIDQNFEEIKDLLEDNKRKQSNESQNNNSQEIKDLANKFESMQASMQMEMMQENMDDLRGILDNLIKLSFGQEDLIHSFREVQQIDPRFIELSQDQLKLKDDAKIIEDSLLSLASRVVQISTFVTREVGEVNRNIDAAVDELKERNRYKALSNQQFAMTSINNLALLLDDVLNQMQMAMSEAMGKPQKDGKGNQSLPNLKQLQQQLSERIQDLKESGMKGRQLSEEVAQMAAEQEALRNQLGELQKKLSGQPGSKEIGDNLQEIIEAMEKNEADLVNKRITNELINRQEAILTRMLEAEESMREQDMDDEREGEVADNYEKQLPKAFEEYFKAREKEVELLKTVPLELNPFYKKEVNDYFRRLSKDN